MRNLPVRCSGGFDNIALCVGLWVPVSISEPPHRQERAEFVSVYNISHCSEFQNK